MATLTHYGVRGMKWKEHRIELPYDPVKAHKKVVGTNDATSYGVILKKRYDTVSAHKVVVGSKTSDEQPVVKKKKRKKLKKLYKTTTQSAQKVVSSMQSLLSKPISSVIRRRQSELLPKLHTMRSGS